MRRLLVLLVVTILLGTACGDDSGRGDTGGEGDGGTPATAADLDGTTFASTGSTGRELVEGTVVSLTFADGSVAFSAGCNSMTAGYEITDGTLVLTSDAGGTLMGCPSEKVDQDEWLSGFLAARPEVTLDGAVLTITAGDESLEFEAAS